jgi:hypothetical protein
MLYWICATVIRPVLTYSSIVWWPRVRYISRMEFNKLQWFARLVVTGATRTIPTAVMEVLPRLLPLHMIIQLEAQARIYRLMCNNQ